jgi:hypothetical protein
VRGWIEGQNFIFEYGFAASCALRDDIKILCGCAVEWAPYSAISTGTDSLRDRRTRLLQR